MASSADYRCRECGWVKEFVFGGSPPATHSAKHVVDVSEQAPEYAPEWVTCFGRLDRVWTAPHTGRGSSGEPPR